MTSISVVIPTYNRASLLPATLEAVLGQTLPADEIIVVDDGSRDETAAVLAGYAPRVRPLRIENAGDLVARNTGLRAAAGDLVAFCDSDDLWAPEFLAGMAALWQAAPGLQAAFCDFVLVRDGQWQEARKFADAPPEFWRGMREVGPEMAVFAQPVADRLIGFQPIFPSCLVVDRAGFLARGGWDEAVSRMVGCDFATALRIAEYPPLGVLRRPLVGIRKHAGNFSADLQTMNLGDALVLEHVLATRPSMQPHAAAIRDSIAQRRRAALETAFTRRDFAAVRQIYALLPPAYRTPAIMAKRLAAGLPDPVGQAAAAALLSLGTLKSRLVARSTD